MLIKRNNCHLLLVKLTKQMNFTFLCLQKPWNSKKSRTTLNTKCTHTHPDTFITHIHSYTHIHTHKHIHTGTHSHAHMCAHMHIHTQRVLLTHRHSPMHSYTWTATHKLTPPHMHTHSYAHMKQAHAQHTCLITYTMHAHTCTYIHPCLRPLTHLQTCSHTTLWQQFSVMNTECPYPLVTPPFPSPKQGKRQFKEKSQWHSQEWRQLRNRGFQSEK